VSDNTVSMEDQLVLALVSPKVVEALTKIFDTLLQDKLSAIESSLRKITDELCTRVKGLESENHELKMRVDRLESYSRIDNLIIHGLPETYAEKVSSGVTSNQSVDDATVTGESSQVSETLFVDFCRDKLNVHLQPHDISICHRLQKKVNVNNSSRAQHRPIIVRFTNRKAKAAVLVAKKQLRYNDECKSVYINEHLSTHVSKLFTAARKLQKDKKILSTWTSGGRIHMKLLNGRIKTVDKDEDLMHY